MKNIKFSHKTYKNANQYQQFLSTCKGEYENKKTVSCNADTVDKMYWAVTQININLKSFIKKKGHLYIPRP